MIKEIKAAFKRNLPNLSWMDEQTRRSAEEKANAVIDMIGFPKYILNKTALDKRYETVSDHTRTVFKCQIYFLLSAGSARVSNAEFTN